MGTLDGKVALVTGAARGMGRSHAVVLAEAGADVIAIDICKQIPEVPAKLATPEDLEETKALVEATGRRITTHHADVRDHAALSAAVAAGVAELGRLDVVVANAGTYLVSAEEPTDPARNAEIWKTTLDVNLTGVFNTIEASVPHIQAGGRGGSIVIISSNAALQTVANGDTATTAYTVSKWGVTGLMKMAAGDLGARGIRVNAVHPSGVATPLIESEAVTEYWNLPRNVEFAAHAATRYLQVTPRDVSEAALFLASDAASAISGISLPVDHGSLVRWR